MFVLLALVFIVGFVFFGVGSGSTGISDVMQNFFSNSSSGGSSGTSLLNKAEKNPTNAADWRAAATKLEAEAKLDPAITALTRYTALKPKAQDALQELGGLYIRRATEEDQVYIDAQTRTSVLSPAVPDPPSSTSALGKALSSQTSAIQSAVSSVVGTTGSGAYTAIITFETEAVGVYKTLAKLNPKDATAQYRLAQIAQGAGDSTTAIAAYKRVLKLTPTGPYGVAAKKALKQLQPQAKAATSGSTHK
jgi:tetratricopeptide (TPR) repeat protein